MLHAARSPITHAHRCALPVLVAIAEHENPLLDVYGLEFAHRLAQVRGQAPRIVQCAGHNHMSIMAHFDSGDDTLGREILQFWAGGAVTQGMKLPPFTSRIAPVE
jgi:hypothetical protein